MHEEQDAYTITEFCKRNRLSRAGYYALPRENRPQEMRVSEKRVLISREAAAEWRARMTAKTAAEQA